MTLQPAVARPSAPAAWLCLWHRHHGGCLARSKLLANRLLADSLPADQDGAYVKLYLNTVGDGAGGVDETASMSIAGPVSLLGFSISITPGEVTTATVNFSFSNQPTIDLKTA